ncbi:hypothetical protein [Halomonas stenophila]|uniref:Outer membrane protein beta-barrel domain-containing protein n=1 Tax=Halomonas stenophila TaxID=795312 RepID=A0A7W5EV69_9GAMM|nr:hypothetical protein [Halomonas stenophila]MBB3231667.1 hypothetical protein [Halomonas stenophila]
MNIQAIWRPLVVAIAVVVAVPGLAAAERPAFSGQATDLALLDNGLSLQGDDVDSLDGVTSGFRLTAGFSPPGLPRLDLGAEVSYRESDDVPVSADGQQRILDTTSLGGSLMAGVRLGRVGLYAKSGLAGWQGEAVTGVDAAGPGGGTARVNGFGARLRMNRVVSRLEYESFDDPMLSHLNLITASVHLPF